jgi:hypothetical protein
LTATVDPDRSASHAPIETAGAVGAFLSPFMPYLKEAGKIAGKKLAEVAAQKGGEAAWKKAQDIWGRITGQSSEAPELKSAAGLVAVKPEDETYQTVFARALASYLETNPAFAKELVDLMGGEESLQEVLAEKGSWIEDVKQEMVGTGRQTIRATDDSVIKGATQTKTK